MTTKKTRIKHSPEFKAEALKLADKVGVAATARQLSLHESQIYGWRKNSKKDTNTSQREQELAAEVAKLKRQLAEQAEELEIVKKAALAIATAASLEHIYSIRVQSVDEQAMQSMERARNLALTHQIAQSNHIRGLLSEFGIILPQGLTSLREGIPFVLEDAQNGLPDRFRAVLLRLWEHLLVQIDHLDDLTKQLEIAIKDNDVCQKLMKLEGVGPLGALGLALRLGKGENFSSGRSASASIGLTPKQHSSGGKERIGHISKKSADMRLRSTLFQGALSVVSLVVNRPARTNKEQWLKALVERRGKKVAAIALANKTVRTAYALLKNDSVYQLEKLA